VTTYRPTGLTDREKQALERLSKKTRLTDMEVGQLSWYAMAGTRDEAAQARRIIEKHKKSRKGKT
jgi:hypothetical protein